MKKLAVILIFSFLPLGYAHSECFVVGRDDSGQDIVECNDRTEPLPICGSEFDTGGRCVTVRQRKPMDGRLIDNNRDGNNNSVGNYQDHSATGDTPFNAGGSWPNRAREIANGQQPRKP